MASRNVSWVFRLASRLILESSCWFFLLFLLGVVVCGVAVVISLPSHLSYYYDLQGVSVIDALHLFTHHLVEICEIKAGGDRFDPP